MNSPQQDQQIELTKNQQNPYLARPEDFEVVAPDKIASRTQPFHGQRGDSDREEAKLLAPIVGARCPKYPYVSTQDVALGCSRSSPGR